MCNTANNIAEMDRMGLEDYYKQGMLNIENDIYSEHPEFIEFVPVRDPEGNVVGWQKSLNEEGKAELERRQNMLTSKYEEGLAKIEEDRAKITNGIFWADTALTTASNLIRL